MDFTLAETNLTLAETNLTLAEMNFTLAEANLTLAETNFTLAEMNLTLAEVRETWGISSANGLFLCILCTNGGIRCFSKLAGEAEKVNYPFVVFFWGKLCKMCLMGYVWGMGEVLFCVVGGERY